MHAMRAGAFAALVTVTTVVAAGCGAAASPLTTAAGASPSVAAFEGSASPAGPGASTSPAVAVSVLPVECTQTGTTLGADAVAAQPDGVHFRIRNSSGAEREFEVDGVGGDAAPAVATSTVWVIAPGPAKVRCQPMDGGADAEWAAFTVTDPAGIHVPDRVTCDTSSTAIMDYPSAATGEHGDPVRIAQRHLRGLRPGDVVERAGYPATVTPKVRVVRDAKVIGLGRYEPALDGGWLLSEVDTCSGAGISWGS